MATYKEKPCPSCGELVRIPKGDICSRCKLKIADYDRLKAAVEERMADCHTFGFYRQLPLPTAHGIKEGSDTTENFRQQLETLINLLSPIHPGGHKGATAITAGRADYRIDRCFEARSEFGGEYYRFTHTLKWLLNEAYEKGKQHGKSLLRMLNEGAISVNDFYRGR